MAIALIAFVTYKRSIRRCMFGPRPVSVTHSGTQMRGKDSSMHDGREAEQVTLGLLAVKVSEAPGDVMRILEEVVMLASNCVRTVMVALLDQTAAALLTLFGSFCYPF